MLNKQISSLLLLLMLSIGFVEANTVVCRKDVNGKPIYGSTAYGCDKPKPPRPPSLEPPKPKKPVLYYADWDPNSQKAREFFREQHIVIEAYDIEQNHEALETKKKLDPDFQGIPLAIINGITIRGFDEKKYRDALATKPKPRQ